jgi:hypothetical protein
VVAGSNGGGTRFAHRVVVRHAAIEEPISDEGRDQGPDTLAGGVPPGRGTPAGSAKS